MVVVEKLGNLVLITPLDRSSLGHSVVEPVVVKLKPVVVTLVVAEEHLGIHLLLSGLPLSHVASTNHPGNDDGRETDQESAEKQPRLQVRLENVQVADSLSVIRQVEVVLWPDLDKLVRATTWSDRACQRSSEQTVTRLPGQVDSVTVSHTSLHSSSTSVVTREGNRSI